MNDLKKTILIHWHPQFSYFARCIIESASYLGTSLNDLKVFALMGPNFLTYTASTSSVFLNSIRPHLQEICGLELELIDTPEYFNYPSSSKNFSGDEHCIAEFETSLMSNLKALQLLRASSRDSVSRGLDQQVDTLRSFIDSGYRQDVEKLRYTYSINLGDYYSRILSEVAPDIVCISHGNYDFYVALYLAAFFKSIPTLVSNGGHLCSYVTSTDQITDPGIASSYQSLIEYYVNTPSAICEHRLSDYNMNNETILDLERNTCSTILYNQDLSSGPIREVVKSKPLVVLPVFGEVSLHNVLGLNRFTSKCQWLESIISSLSTSDASAVYFHPHTNFHSQMELTKYIVKYVAEKYSYRGDILTTPEELLKHSKFSRYIPVSMGGTISLELAARNKTSIVSNECTSTPIPGANFIFDGYTSIHKIVEACSHFNTINNTSNEILINSIKQAQLRIKAPSHKNALDFYMRKLFDKFYFFGDSKCNDHSVLAQFLANYARLFVARNDIATPKFNHLLTHFNGS